MNGLKKTNFSDAIILWQINNAKESLYRAPAILPFQEVFFNVRGLKTWKSFVWDKLEGEPFFFVRHFGSLLMTAQPLSQGLSTFNRPPAPLRSYSEGIAS